MPGKRIKALMDETNVDLKIIYNMISQSIEIEYLKLEAYATLGDDGAYQKSVRNILQSQRFLCLIRMGELADFTPEKMNHFP